MKLLRHFIIIYCLNSTGLLQAETHGNDAKVKDPLPTLTDCPKPSTSPLFVLVKQLDGTERNAELLSLTEKELKLSGDSNRIPLSEIESIQFPPAPKKPLSTFKIVELLEGGHLYAKSLSLNKASDKITVTLLNNKQVELPSKQVSATRFNVHPKTKQKLDKQWQEIVTNSKDADGDILIIKDRAPDYITGFIESISDKNIEFKYEGEVRTIDRERVLAVKLLHSQKPAPSHKIWVNTSDGSRVPSTSLTMESGNIRAKQNLGSFATHPIFFLP